MAPFSELFSSDEVRFFGPERKARNAHPQRFAPYARKPAPAAASTAAASSSPAAPAAAPSSDAKRDLLNGLERQVASLLKGEERKKKEKKKEGKWT